MNLRKMSKLNIFIFLAVFYTCAVHSSNGTLDEWKKLFFMNHTQGSMRPVLINVMRETMNFSVDPCNDFYQYACGNYKEGRLHGAPSVVSNEMDLLGIKLGFVRENDLSADITESSNGYVFPWENFQNSVPITAAELKLRDFYQSCMDVDTIKERGPQLAVNFMQSYMDWLTNDRVSWQDILMELLYMNKPTFVRFVYVTVKNTTLWVLAPPNEWPEYKKSQKKGKKSCSFYKTDEMKKVLSYVGVEEKHVQPVIDDAIMFHKMLSHIEISLSDDESFTGISELPIQKFSELLPSINWEKLITLVTQKPLDKDEKVPIKDGEFFESLEEVLFEASNDTIKKYLFLELAYLVAEYSSDIISVPKRSKYCYKKTVYLMQNVADAFFLRRHFSTEMDEDILGMAGGLRNQFVPYLDTCTWMKESDRQLLADKIHQSTINVAYWPKDNYHKVLKKEMEFMNSIIIHPKRYFQNAMQLQKHKYEFDISTLREYFQKVDVTNINAQYDPNINELQIFLGISLPPFYHPLYPGWAKFGRIGSILGHEFCHAIDFNNYMYDANVKVQKMSGETLINYFIQSLCLGRRYNDFTFIDKGHIDGANTIGENIADHAGLKLSYMAYEQWLNQHWDQQQKEEIPELNLTPRQGFFLSFAQNWCSYRDDDADLDLSDVHSPNEARVLITLAYNKDFAEAYRCPRGSKMNPIKKCEFS